VKIFMNQTIIGIFVDELAARLAQTLAALQAHTAEPHEIRLLVTEAQSAVLKADSSLQAFPQWITKSAGAPAAFNNLVQGERAELYLLLECGAVVAPGWLERLQAGLDAHPRNGLAGPSTNHCWNAQAVFPRIAESSAETVAQCAREALRRFGSQARTLEPLYSLADFCYAVRREVVEEIGLVDEGYGSGPCWEMDYNIRAARAGWRGVWAGASYVHRAPFAECRRIEEARLFDASKRRYQDKFCGARLRGEKNDYRPHCRGDACPNFAPGGSLKINHLAAANVAVPAVPKDCVKPGVLEVVSEEPLVSCIMPTCDRLGFALESVRCFFRQDYPNLELVIVDDGTEPVAPVLPSDPRIRLLRLEKKVLGAKRNVACASARGDIIAHWDDDDWYPANRIRRQEAALRTGSSTEICGTSTLFYHDAAVGRAWRYRHSSTGRSWVAGNTLAYRKSWWAGHPFPEIQVGEDTRFVWAAPPGTVCDLASPDLCVARRHTGNTSPKQTVGACWQGCAVRELESLLGDQWALFLSVGDSQVPAGRMPIVSCIMPTFNRRRFLPLTLEAFINQDYPKKELIVVDDGTDSVRDIFQGVPGVRYLRLESRTPIGEKRNLACTAAEGAIIAHWDDDDWYAPSRLREQISPLLLAKADLTGLANSYLLELPAGRFWSTHAELHRRMFTGDVHGGTLVYWKRLISPQLKYPAISLAEDAVFILAALRAQKRLLRLPNDGIFVYVRHGQNAWQFQPGQFLDPAGWEMVPSPLGFSAERLTAYQNAASVG
jgi:O-antigen biosynthesis protein